MGAGPGSGKTRVLVHKVAALLLLEDIKPEQFLMLTFSRPAATEFKERLHHLIGNAAYHIDILIITVLLSSCWAASATWPNRLT